MGNLMNSLKSVEIGFQTFSSLPADDDRHWTLKPCINAKPSPELDRMIVDFISQNSNQLNFVREMKPLICKHTDTDQASVSEFFATLQKIRDPRSSLLAQI